MMCSDKSVGLGGVVALVKFGLVLKFGRFTDLFLSVNKFCALTSALEEEITLPDVASGLNAQNCSSSAWP